MKAGKAFYNLAQSRQQEIIDKTIRLYANNAYENVTVRLICQELAININTFYRYFPSKDDLYLFLYLKLDERIGITSDYVWSMEEYILNGQQMQNIYTECELRFLGSWRTLPEDMLQRLFFDPELNPREVTRLNIERGMADGSFRSDLDIDLVTYLFHTATYLVLRYARERGMDSYTELERLKQYTLYDFFSYGLRGQKKLPQKDGSEK